VEELRSLASNGILTTALRYVCTNTDRWRKAWYCWRQEERPTASMSDSAASERRPWLAPRNVSSAAPSSHPLPAGLVPSPQHLRPRQRCRSVVVVARSCGEGRTAWWCWTSRGRHRAEEEDCRRQRYSAHWLAVQRSHLVAACPSPSTDCQSKLDELALQLPVNIQSGPKNGLFLRSVNFATTNDRKACNMSKVSEFCLEWNA